jgi:hypothetical protein
LRASLAALAALLCSLVAPAVGAAPLTVGNLLVSQSDTVFECTPAGVVVQSFPVPPAGGGTEWARDLVVGSTGQVHVYNGTFNPTMSSLDPTTGSWSGVTYPGWSTINNTTYGGIATFPGFVFVTDMATAYAGAPSGMVRFDLAQGTSTHFAAASYLDVTAGLDGLLYAFDGYSVGVFNPSTLALQRTFTPVASCRGIAVNAAGHLFCADTSGFVNPRRRVPRGGDLRAAGQCVRRGRAARRDAVRRRRVQQRGVRDRDRRQGSGRSGRLRVSHEPWSAGARDHRRLPAVARAAAAATARAAPSARLPREHRRIPNAGIQLSAADGDLVLHHFAAARLVGPRPAGEAHTAFFQFGTPGRGHEGEPDMPCRCRHLVTKHVVSAVVVQRSLDTAKLLAWRRAPPVGDPCRLRRRRRGGSLFPLQLEALPCNLLRRPGVPLRGRESSRVGAGGRRRSGPAAAARAARGKGIGGRLHASTATRLRRIDRRCPPLGRRPLPGGPRWTARG